VRALEQTAPAASRWSCVCAPRFGLRARSHTDDAAPCVLEHEPETGLGIFAAYLEAAAVDYELVKTTQGALPDADRFGNRAWRQPRRL
jgi:hypothetical protein